MTVIAFGVAVTLVYVIGVFMGVWIGRTYPSKTTTNWRDWDNYDKQVVASSEDGVNVTTIYLTAFYLKGELLSVTKTIERAYSTGTDFFRHAPHTIQMVNDNAPYSEYLAAKNKNNSKRDLPPLKKPKK